MCHDLYGCGHGQLQRASWTGLSDEIEAVVDVE